MFSIASIVEGHGEVKAVPVLLRRIATDYNPNFPVDVKRPIRLARDKIFKDQELERAIELASRMIKGEGAILIIFDADDDCPRAIAPDVLRKAQLMRPDKIIKVILPKSEFEAWFLSSIGSLSGQRGLPDNLTVPLAPEEIRDAKGWLSRVMPSGYAYSETVDQPALAALFSFEEAARNSESFAKLLRDMHSLIPAP